MRGRRNPARPHHARNGKETDVAQPQFATELHAASKMTLEQVTAASAFISSEIPTVRTTQPQGTNHFRRAGKAIRHQNRIPDSQHICRARLVRWHRHNLVAAERPPHPAIPDSPEFCRPPANSRQTSSADSPAPPPHAPGTQTVRLRFAAAQCQLHWYGSKRPTKRSRPIRITSPPSIVPGSVMKRRGR